MRTSRRSRWRQAMRERSHGSNPWRCHGPHTVARKRFDSSRRRRRKTVSGCSSAAEHVAHSYDATGAIPVARTITSLDVAQQQELVGDNHAVAGASPAIETHAPLFLGQGHDSAKIDWLRFESSQWHPFIRHRLGRSRPPKQRSSVRFTGGVLRPDLRSGPPCGVTTAG